MKITILICTFLLATAGAFGDAIRKIYKIVIVILLSLIIFVCSYIEYNNEQESLRETAVKDSLQIDKFEKLLKEKDETIAIQKTTINNFHYSLTVKASEKHTPTFEDTEKYIKRAINPDQNESRTTIDIIYLRESDGFDKDFGDKIEAYLKSKNIKVINQGTYQGQGLYYTFGINIFKLNDHSLAFYVSHL